MNGSSEKIETVPAGDAEVEALIHAAIMEVERERLVLALPIGAEFPFGILEDHRHMADRYASVIARVITASATPARAADECACGSPLIRCDHLGCRCVHCGKSEGRRARSTLAGGSSVK